MRPVCLLLLLICGCASPFPTGPVSPKPGPGGSQIEIDDNLPDNVRQATLYRALARECDRHAYATTDDLLRIGKDLSEQHKLPKAGGALRQAVPDLKPGLRLTGNDDLNQRIADGLRKLADQIGH